MTDIPVSVGIWGPGGKRYVRGFGAADLATARRPISTTDRFRVGSITKTFVGTLILRLAQERHLSLDEPLSHFYKWIPYATQITIRTLLDHTSLIPGFATSTLLQFQNNRAMRFVPDQVIRAAVAEPYFQSPPLFNYSDINYVILGRIAERVTRQPLARLLARRILMPLGLHNTYSDPGTTIRGVHAHGYLVSGDLIDVTNWTTSYGWAAGSMGLDARRFESLGVRSRPRSAARPGDTATAAAIHRDAGRIQLRAAHHAAGRVLRAQWPDPWIRLDDALVVQVARDDRDPRERISAVRLPRALESVPAPARGAGHA